MPVMIKKALMLGLLAATTVVKAMPYGPDYFGPDDPDRENWADGHRQPDAELKGTEHMETFHGVHEGTNVPQKKPFHYKTQGIDWYNFAKVDSDKVLGKNIIDFPKGHRRTQVAAVAGVADKQGRAISNTVAMMTLQPHSAVCRFDVRSIDFFCLDDTHRAVACSMGIFTSINQGNGEVNGVKTQKFHFEPHTNWRTQMSRAYLKPELGTGLVLASMGLDLANVADAMKSENVSDTAAVENYSTTQKVTLYVDNISWISHKCFEGTWAVIVHHFAQWLNAVQDPAASESSVPNKEADEIIDRVYGASESDDEDEKKKADKKLEDDEHKQREDMEMLHHKLAYHKHPFLKWLVNTGHALGEKLLHKGQDTSLDALDKIST